MALGSRVQSPDLMPSVRQQGRHLLQRGGRQAVVGEQRDIGYGGTLKGRLAKANSSDEEAPCSSRREQSEGQVLTAGCPGTCMDIRCDTINGTVMLSTPAESSLHPGHTASCWKELGAKHENAHGTCGSGLPASSSERRPHC